MTPRIQIVGRLPVDLSRRVRAAAKQQRVSQRVTSELHAQAAVNDAPV